MIAYSNALRELGKGTIQINLTKKVSIVDDEEYELLDLLLAESRRPVTLSSLLERADMPEAHQEMRRKLAPLMPRGVVPQTSSVPRKKDITLRAPTVFFSFRCFAPVFDRSKEEQAAIYRDLIVDMKQNPERIEPALSLFCAVRNLERIADHATNIAEETVFLVEGQMLRHKHVFDAKAFADRNGAATPAALGASA